MKDDNVLLSCIGVVGLAVVTVIFGSLLSGWVLSILWDWFVTSLFNVPSLSILQAMGFALVVGLLTHQEFDSPKQEKSTTERFASLISIALVKPLIYLFIGWVIKSFVG